MSEYLQPLQLGFGVPLGCEAAIHAARSFAYLRDGSDSIIFKVDLENAFNMVERDVFLKRVLERVPSLFPFLHQCYARPSNLFFGTIPVESQVGAQQGDPLGPLIFSLAIHDVVSSLRSPLNLWYLDDGTVGGDADEVLSDIESLVQGLAALGLRINPRKSEVFACAGQLSPATQKRLDVLVPGAKLLDRTTFMLLGAPIFPEGVPALVLSKMRTLAETKSHLCQLSAHVALSILRGCLSIPRLTYSLRTAPVWLHREESKQYDEVLKDLLEAIVNISMSNEQWSQAALPVRYGGLGLRRLEDTQLPAFLASSCGVLRLVTRILHVNGDEFSIPHAAEALELWQSVCPESAVPVQPERQRAWDEEQCRLQLNMLMLRNAGAELARLRAVSQPESGLWLHALPSPQLGTLLDNDSLRVAVALRLGCTVVEPHVCVCGARVDQSGRHGLHCVRSAGRFSRHHAINDIVRRALVSADVPAVLEPPGLSRADGKRPDGLTMVPWEKGRSLLWDATCVCTLAPSHVQSTAANAGAAAEAAARLKKLKYSQLMQRYLFVPLAVETMGVWGEEGRAFLREITRRLRSRGLGSSSGAHLMQRLSLAVQRGNAASVMGTFGSGVARRGIFD
ncbi:uncharacterized protein LOC125490434 [Plutella xylostella]|uniref:uncharacterized protein LOC125490434 n=1 Tax=Plutella xylostella TaxID=51655 RepID=UPI00203263CB|nr:uncharacterized protein LOC125490434 [Plutella xylostella]